MEIEAEKDETEKQDAEILLTPSDYLLGVYDAVGELMRWAITGIALNGTIPIPTSNSLSPSSTSPKFDGTTTSTFLPSSETTNRSMVTDMRELRSWLGIVDANGSAMDRDLESKKNVMRASGEKVESAVYGVVVRGRERPKGWVPEDRAEVVEGY